MGQKVKIGTNARTYAELRNFLQFNFEKYEYIYPKDIFFFARLVKYVIPKYYNISRYSFYDFQFYDFQFLHFFNTISFGKRPWICTFETLVPRWFGISRKNFRKGIQQINDSSCYKLIAISENAKNIQIDLLHNNYKEYLDDIYKKIVVKLPPQEILIDHWENKNIKKDRLIFCFIGNLFFRKGGIEILKVHEYCKDHGMEFDLKIISNFKTGDKVSKSTSEDISRVLKYIGSNKESIEVFSDISNPEVLEILKQSHVFLFPTYADTFGYAVLEAQSCGCPVISTNVRALPELNNENIGWLINLPVNDLGETDISKLSLMKEQVIEELIDIINEIYSNSDIIIQKGNDSIKNLEQNNNPVEYKMYLEELYSRLLLHYDIL